MRNLLVILVMLIGVQSFAQRPGEYSTTNKKAIKYFEAAVGCLRTKNFPCVEENCNKAIKKDENFIEAYIVLADGYSMTKKYDKAMALYEKTIQINPNFYTESYFHLGEFAMKQGLYDKAEASYTKYLSYGRTRPEFKATAQLGIANCRFARKALQNPVPFKPENMGPNINSDMQEYFPCVTADNGVFMFTRRLEDPAAYQGLNEDFYVSTRQNGEWTKARNFGFPINTKHNEGAPTLSVDGQSIIFTACDLFDSYGGDRKGIGSCDLFFTRRIGRKWMKPRNLGHKVNSKHWETQPSFSADGKTLYFIRGFRSGYRITDQDIYTAHLLDEGGWSHPKKLSSVVNSPGNEESVFIHPDGKTLYFSSDGHPGMGGMDIYVTRKGADGRWSKPMNLGYPINTFNDENSLLVDTKGKLAYFASDREGGYGDLDLYKFELHEAARPAVVTYMKGKVYDENTKEPLVAEFELIDTESGEIVAGSWSNEADGEFLICVPEGRNYALNVSRKYYMDFSESFVMQNSHGHAPFMMDVPMKPIKVGKSMVLKNVFFDTDKFDLKPASKVELKKLKEFLEQNPKLIIEIGGHTDNKGNAEANQLLSENRAKAVISFLTEQGVAANRLKAKGYGQEVPIASNDTDEGRALNRRTEYKVLEIVGE